MNSIALRGRGGGSRAAFALRGRGGAFGGMMEIVRNIPDTLMLSDGIEVVVRRARELNETITISDQVSRTARYTRLITDTLMLSDLVDHGRHFIDNLSEMLQFNFHAMHVVTTQVIHRTHYRVFGIVTETLRKRQR